MMSSCNSLVVLGNEDIHNLLINLKLPEILRFHDEIATCLLELALGKEREYQPEASIVNRPEGQKILFRPFTSANGMGTKIIATPRPITTAEGLRHPPLCGIVTICDAGGNPTGILNGKEITGFRTTMSSMIPFLWRSNVESIVIFGAGVQALWHGRLALALRGSEVKTLTIINRSSSRANGVVSQLEKENSILWKSRVKLGYLDCSGSDYSDLVSSLVRNASVIFCTTPSTTPLFPSSYITDPLQSTPDKAQPLITAVGSWQANMNEIHSELIHHAIQESNDIDFSSKDAKGSQTKRGGAIVTDDREVSLKDAGEVVQSGLVEEQLLELGDLIERRRKGALSTTVKEWMASGFLIYKSIGVSVTDLVTSEIILDLAKEKGLGTTLSSF